MKKPKIFIQKCGSYSDEVLVICGANKKEVSRFLKREKVKVSFSKWILADFDDWNERVTTNQNGLFCFNNEVYGMVLVLRSIVKCGDWRYWETLMHELNHLVLNLSQKKGFEKEAENQAYLFDHLFRSIRRKIQGED